jgi:DNA-binding transcriptional regulator YiaG
LPFCHIALKAQRPLPNAYPKSLKTIGDHIRKRRLDLGLLQTEVARLFGVCTSTVCNWESNESTPVVRFTPAIQAFLGYDPWPQEESFGGRLRAARRRLGLSQRQFAVQLGVDASTLGDWEASRHRPTRKSQKRVDQSHGDAHQALARRRKLP